MRRAERIAGKARLSELFIWDGVLLGLVVALAVADRSLPARAGTPAPAPAVASPPPVAPPAGKGSATPAEPVRPLRGPRRAGGEAKTALDAAEKAAREHLAAGRLDEALAAVDDVPAGVRGSPEHTALIGRLEGEVLRRAEAVAALPRLQALMDLGRLTGLETELSALPAGPEQERLRADLEAARKRPGAAGGSGDGFQVREFRPGWGAVKGGRVTVESGLPADEARLLAEALDSVVALAGDLRGEPLPAPTVVVHEPDAPPGGGLVTWRRAGEPREALQGRARWVLALSLARSWQLERAPRWVAEGLPAALATAGAAGGARPAQTPAGRALRRLFRAKPPRGDGSELLTLLAAGQVEPVRAWALATFAASSDPAAAPLRKALQGALRPGAGGAPPSLAPDQATTLEAAWLAFLERP